MTEVVELSSELSTASSSEPTSILKHSSKMALGTLISRITGQVRSIFLIWALGTTGLAANAFDLANSLPNFIFIIISGGLLNSVLVPQITKYFKQENTQTKINQLVTFCLLIVLILTIICEIASPILIKFYASSSWTSEQLNLAISFAYLCLPQIFFYGLYLIIGQVLASQERFTSYFFAPILNNLISILILGTFIYTFGSKSTNQLDLLQSWSTEKIIWIGLGSTLGVIIQAIFLFIPLRQLRKSLPATDPLHYKFKVIFKFRGFGLKSLSKIAFWTLMLVLLEEAVTWIIQKITSAAPMDQLGDMSETIAGNAAYNQSSIIFLVPYSLITVSLSTAIFTKMANYIHEQKPQLAFDTMIYGIKHNTVYAIYFTALFFMLSTFIIRLLLPSLSETEIYLLSDIVRFQSLGYFSMAVILFARKIYYAVQKPMHLFWISLPLIILQMLTFYFLQFIFENKDWAAMIALFNVLISIITMIVLLVDIKFLLKIKTNYWPIFRTLLLSILAVIPTIVVVSVLMYFLNPYFELMNYFEILLETAILGVISIILYLVTLKLLKVPEIEPIFNQIVRKIFRKKI